MGGSGYVVGDYDVWLVYIPLVYSILAVTLVTCCMETCMFMRCKEGKLGKGRPFYIKMWTCCSSVRSVRARSARIPIISLFHVSITWLKLEEHHSHRSLIPPENHSKISARMQTRLWRKLEHQRSNTGMFARRTRTWTCSCCASHVRSCRACEKFGSMEYEILALETSKSGIQTTNTRSITTHSWVDWRFTHFERNL